jgi:hypothetical protein
LSSHTLESRVNSRFGSGRMMNSSGVGHAVDEAARDRQLLVGHAGHQDLGEIHGGQAGQVVPEGLGQRRPDRLRAQRGVEQLVARLGLLQRLGEQLAQVEHLDPVVAQRLREVVVLLLRAVDPGDAVEQQLVGVAGREPPQLVPGPMQDDRAQAPDLAPDAVGAHAAQPIPTGPDTPHAPILRPTMRLEGIHHITAITGDAPRNVRFYVGVLGLRLVKKTVNQDDPTVYHLFYGDDDGSPGWT